MMWTVMVEDIDPLNPYYLPLDVPDRQDWLDQLNERENWNLTTDWSPRASKNNNYDLRYTDLDAVPKIRELCERIQPFLDKFYC